MITPPKDKAKIAAVHRVTCHTLGDALRSHQDGTKDAFFEGFCRFPVRSQSPASHQAGTKDASGEGSFRLSRTAWVASISQSKTSLPRALLFGMPACIT